MAASTIALRKSCAWRVLSIFVPVFSFNKYYLERPLHTNRRTAEEKKKEKKKKREEREEGWDREKEKEKLLLGNLVLRKICNITKCTRWHGRKLKILENKEESRVRSQDWMRSMYLSRSLTSVSLQPFVEFVRIAMWWNKEKQVHRVRLLRTVKDEQNRYTACAFNWCHPVITIGKKSLWKMDFDENLTIPLFSTLCICYFKYARKLTFIVGFNIYKLMN